MLTFVGKQVGERWETWKDSLHYVDYTVAALILVGIAYLILRGRGRRGKPEAAREPAADAPR
jgi:hypothetical protein